VRLRPISSRPRQLTCPRCCPPPPAAGSAAERVELDQVLAAQAARTPEQAARCVQVENETIWLFGAGGARSLVHRGQPAEDRGLLRRRPRGLPSRSTAPPRRCTAETPALRRSADQALRGVRRHRRLPERPRHPVVAVGGPAGEIFPDQAGGFQLRAATTRNFAVISGVRLSRRPGRRPARSAKPSARELLENPAVRKIIAELPRRGRAPPASGGPLIGFHAKCRVSGDFFAHFALRVKSVAPAGVNVSLSPP